MENENNNQAQEQNQVQTQETQQEKQPKTDFLGSLPEKLVAFLPIAIIVMLGLAALAVVYHFIIAIADAIQFDSFLAFMDGLANGFFHCAIYAFFAFVLAVLKKILKK